MSSERRAGHIDSTNSPLSGGERFGDGASVRAGFQIARLQRLIWTRLAAERERWFLWFPVGLGFGIAIYFALPSEPPPLAGIGVFILTSIFALAARNRRGLLVIWIALAVTTAGFAIAQGHGLMVAEPVYSGASKPVRLNGRVLAVESLARGRRLTLGDLVIPGLDKDRTPRKARIRLASREPKLAVGESIAITARLRPPPPPVAPGAFDFQRWAYFKQIGAFGFALGAPRLLPTEGVKRGGVAQLRQRLSERVGRLRQYLFDRVVAAIDGPAGGVAAALITGKRGAIDSKTLTAMRDSGLAHLLAISGLHIGLVAGLLFIAVRTGLAAIEPVALARPIKKWAAAAALAGAFSYLIISGASVPTQRAFVMAGLVLSAVLVDRVGISMRLVALAAVVVLLIAPESLLGPSFQMSFAAVTALIAVYEIVGGRIALWMAAGGGVRRISAYVATTAISTLVAGLATAPFALFHFNRIALFGLVANIIAVPVMAMWIMPFAIAALLLMPFGLEGAALAPMGWGIDLVIAVARMVSGWSGAALLLPAMPVAGLALAALGGLWFALWRGGWRLWGLGAIVAGLATVALPRPPDILVNDNGRLMAVRAADGSLRLSTRRSDRFTGEAWLRREGEAVISVWPRDGFIGARRLSCDRLGCMYEAKNQRIALIRDARAYEDDCRIADIVISAVPLRKPCASASLIVDRYDLWRDGGHAFWLARGGRVRVETVNQGRKGRPWTPPRHRRERP